MVLPLLRALVPADYSSYNEVPADGGEGIAIVEPELPAWVHESWARLATTNPLIVRHMATRDGRPRRFSDVIGRTELHQLVIYREIYRRLGIEHQVAFALPAPSSITIGVALSRGGRVDFSDEERGMLEVVRPHLIQAYRNAQLRQKAAGLMRALRQGLDGHGDAVLLTDAEGTVILSTESGRALAGQLAGRPVSDGQPLPAAVAEPAPGGGAVLVQRIATADGSTAVFLARPELKLSPATLEGFGLTPREATVLAALATGRSTTTVAGDLGISPRTVLKHSERIHRKLGVTNRAQAVATAWAAAEAASA